MSALDHVTVTVPAPDFPARAAMYDAAFAAIDLVRLRELVDEEEDDPAVEAAAWGAPGTEPIIWLVVGERPTSGLHVRLRANSRAQVEAFHAAAVATGAAGHSAPRRWALYRPGEFNAIVADHEGNLIEAVAAE